MSERSTGSSSSVDDTRYTTRRQLLGPPISSSYAEGRNCTTCGRKSSHEISWTNQNPGRRFDRCLRQKAEGNCNFFRWYDEEGEVLSSFTKVLIAELRDAVWDKMEHISILEEKMKKKDTEMQRLEMELLQHHHLGMEMQQKGKKYGSWFRLFLTVLVSAGVAMAVGMITSPR